MDQGGHMADLFTKAEMDKIIVLQDIKNRNLTQQESCQLIILKPLSRKAFAETRGK